MANNAACFPITADEGGQATLNQLTKIRLADGREVLIVDWTWRPLYSTVDTLTGWTDMELRAFTYSVGDPITVSANMTVRETATLMHTNIKTPAEMDSQEEMLVYAIQIEMYAMAEDTAASEIQADLSIGGVLAAPTPLFPNFISILHQQCIGELEISQKEYQQGSLGRFPAGFGIFGNLSTGSDITVGQFTNSSPSYEALDMFPVPVHIGSTEKYAFIVHNPMGRAVTYRDGAGAEVATAVMRLRINLHGLHKRPAG
jgi:hypothetical protein